MPRAFKTTCLAMLTAAGVTAMGQAANALGIWEGTLRVDTVAGCSTDIRLEVGDSWQSFLIPPNVDGNDNKAMLRVRDIHWSFIFKTGVGPLSTGAAYSGQQIDPFGQIATWNGTVAAASVTPATITATTPSLTVNYRMNNVQGVAGCTVTLRGILLREVVN